VSGPLDRYFSGEEKKGEQVTFIERERASIKEIKLPWLGDLVEVGFVTVPKELSIMAGKASKDTLWIRPQYKWVSKLRLGFPLIIYDFLRGEYVAGIIKAFGYDLDDPFFFERKSTEIDVPLTSELIKYNDLSFLESLPVLGLEPICTIKNINGALVRGSVNFAPHVRAPAYIPPEELFGLIFGLPNEGIPYGVIVVADDPIRSPKDNKFYIYRMRQELLFEHELVCGSTGKGKTVKCKNDIYHFIYSVGGTAIVFDLHGEYHLIAEEPNYEDLSDVEKKIWLDMDVKPGKIDDILELVWVPSYEAENIEKDKKFTRYFTINFERVPANSLQYYLPALSPQGYVVLPRLVREFRDGRYGKTLEDFYHWLMTAKLPTSMVSNMTREAIIRRLAPIIEEGIFDAPNLSDIDIKELLKPNRAIVVRLDHIKSTMARRVVAFHIINLVANAKLKDREGKYPPTMILVDEAHNFFPRVTYDDDEKDYVNRTIHWVDRICKEGRKFMLRIEFSTQSPEDLHPNVIKTVNTITFFGMTPVQVNTLERVMDLAVEKNELINLPMRRAIIFSRGNSDIPVKIMIPWPLLKHKITKRG